MIKFKFLSILALLCITASSAWAQTSADKGRILAADGKMYKNVTLANKVSSARAVVAYVGSVAHYWDHCLCLALVDASGPCNWEGAKTAAQSWAASNSITLGSTTYATSHTSWDWASDDTETSCQTRTEGIGYGWRIPNVTDWRYIMAAYGGPSATSPVGVAKGEYGNTVRSAINTACGNSGLNTVAYWTCSTLTGSDPAQKWGVHFQNADNKDVFWTYALSDAPNLRLVFAPDRALTNGYVVEYDANGGSGAPAAQSKTHGTALTLSSDVPTRTGYTFDGWATSADGAVAYDPEATYTGDADVELYAHWTAIAVTGVSLNESTLALSIGGSETLTATVSPTDALNKTVEWTSSNSAVATVSTAGTVTAVNAGTCTVTATTEDGNFKATCTVTVTDPSALTKTGTNEWTLAAMPAYDIEMLAEYYTDLLESNDGSWLASNNGQVADLWLGRTLQPGSYNTLALPFSMTIADFKAATGDNAILVKQLTAASVTGTTLNLTFSDAESITANTPYLVKLSGSAPVTLQGFDLVTVSTADGTVTTSVVDFIPVLSRTQVAGNVKNILFLGANNELLNPSAANQYIKGFRAYFLLKGAAALARSFVLDFGDGEMTGIQTIRTSDQSAAQQQGTYDLQGRRINGQPTQKGIYIVNGKKTIIK